MKAAVLCTNGFVFEERDVPVCGPGQVLVKTAGCGICEGDVFQYVTRMGGAASTQDFIRLGHEGSGAVVAVGHGVKSVQIGDQVTALGGDYAEYFVVEQQNLAQVIAPLNVMTALGEPIACCMSAARRFGIKMGERVAIIGSGYMGLGCLQLAKLQGAAETVVFDLLGWRLETALQLGADKVENVGEKPSADLLAHYGLFDVVIEATGVQAAIDLGTALLRNHGTMNLVGYHQSNGGMRQIDMKTWNFKALTVVNGHVRDEVEKMDAMRAALRLMASGKLDTHVLITNYKFANINQAFMDLKARKTGLFKANLVFA